MDFKGFFAWAEVSAHDVGQNYFGDVRIGLGALGVAVEHLWCPAM
jgi:hypothetical protein